MDITVSKKVWEKSLLGHFECSLHCNYKVKFRRINTLKQQDFIIRKKFCMKKYSQTEKLQKEDV